MHDLLEGLAKLRIEYRIDNGIDEAIDVAQPCGKHEGRQTRPAVFVELGAHGVHDVAREEWQPAEEEDTCVVRTRTQKKKTKQKQGKPTNIQLRSKVIALPNRNEKFSISFFRFFGFR